MSQSVKYVFALVVLSVLMMMAGGLLGGLLGYEKGKNANRPQIIVNDTVIIDTVTIVETRTDTLIRFVGKPYAVPVIDTATNTILKSDTVYLPYEHRFWSDPGVMDIWYSGIDPSIDSARAYNRTIVEQHITESTVPDHKNMTGVVAGAADASVFYLHRFGKRLWLGASAGYTYDGIPTARGVASLSF